MNKNIIHSALFRLIVPILYGTLVYLILLMVNDNLLIINELFITTELLFCILLTYATLEVNRFVINSFFRKNGFSSVGILVQLGTNILTTTLVVFFSLLVYFEIVLGYSSLLGFDTEIKSFALILGITSLLYNMLSISYDLLTTRNEQIYDDEEILREQVLYELENYTAEVNPDLLFESLETAITLIQQDSELTEEFIDRLALVYRYMLSNTDTESTNIAKDIDAANNLIFLYNIRYNNLIKFNVEAVSKDYSIVPGSLPMLIDDIIKHNIISDVRPLTIILDKEDNYLTLSHQNNEKLTNNMANSGTFKRLQAAYSYFTDHPLIKVQAYGDAFYKIPLLTTSTS